MVEYWESRAYASFAFRAQNESDRAHNLNPTGFCKLARVPVVHHHHSTGPFYREHHNLGFTEVNLRGKNCDKGRTGYLGDPNPRWNLANLASNGLRHQKLLKNALKQVETGDPAKRDER